MYRENAAWLGVLGSILIYGTIGVFVRYIPPPSVVIVMAREALVGAVLILGSAVVSELPGKNKEE